MRGSQRARGSRVSLLTLAAVLVAGVAHAATSSGLANLERVALRVEEHADVGGLSPELERRIAEALRKAPRPTLQVDPSSLDVLRLIVGIRAVNATTLRGFYLPFSGIYAVGPLRLALQRRVSVRGASDVIAVVWEDERQVAKPWRSMAAEARRLADELVDAFLEAYRAAAR